jgi:aspartate racemase
MKTIGLIGGMSWESTAIYSSLINREVQKRLGGLHSAKIAMISLDFAEPAELARTSQWDALAVLLTNAAEALARTGAGVLVICANTAHRVADRIEQAVPLPLPHICDCTARQVLATGCMRVALLGTAYTMEEDFYKDRLRSHGLDVIVPDAADRAVIHRMILDELVLGKIEPKSRSACREIIARQVARGAQGIVLGCTELPMLVSAEDSAVPLFDTTQLHALAAVDLAFS